MNDDVRSGILFSHLDSGNTQMVEELLQNSEYSKLCDDDCMYALRLKQKRYIDLIYPLWKSETGHYESSYLVSSLVVAFAWMIFLIHAAQGNLLRWKMIFLPIAFIAGVLSTWAVIIPVVIRDDFYPYVIEHNDMLRNLIFIVVDIGLKEEVFKLLFFVPFAVIFRKESSSHLLLMASLVGLGFAAEENINYYLNGTVETIVGRFLTANYFHVALTGYAGYYLATALQNGGEHWHHFASAFFEVVVAHGVYDFLLMDPSVKELSFLHLTVLIWISKKHLHLLLKDRISKRSSVQLTFTASVSLALSVALAFSLVGPDPLNSSILAASGFLSVAILLFLFFQEFRHA
jgi:RsiW-degrading membrane proteinase PrsW (M82 family)